MGDGCLQAMGRGAYTEPALGPGAQGLACFLQCPHSGRALAPAAVEEAGPKHAPERPPTCAQWGEPGRGQGGGHTALSCGHAETAVLSHQV